jgi:hypothetical protein
MNPKKMRGIEISYPERQFLELRLLGKWGLRRDPAARVLRVRRPPQRLGGARHPDFPAERGAPTLFRGPGSPRQKPQAENLNRTIRHLLPKETKAHGPAAAD